MIRSDSEDEEGFELPAAKRVKQAPSHMDANPNAKKPSPLMSASVTGKIIEREGGASTGVSTEPATKPKVAFVTKAAREKREQQEADAEDRKRQRKEHEQTRLRKEFLLNTRGGYNDRDRRENERRYREDQRRAQRVPGVGSRVHGGGGASSSTAGPGGHRGGAMGNGSATIGGGGGKLAAGLGNSGVTNAQTESALGDFGLLRENAGPGADGGTMGGPSQQELLAVKKQYLGLKEERRKLQKPSEKVGMSKGGQFIPTFSDG